jgi:hypothetical protein
MTSALSVRETRISRTNNNNNNNDDNDDDDDDDILGTIAAD